MTDKTYTAGPWEVVGSMHTDSLSGAKVFADSYFVAVSINNNEAPENDANARLIAAAPDLLEALEAARFRLYGVAKPLDDEWYVKITAAIAKATNNAQ